MLGEEFSFGIDLGLHLQFFKERINTDYRAVELGPAFQTDIGRRQVDAKLFFDRALGAARALPSQLRYQRQVRHGWLPGLPGLHLRLQGFGALGAWDDGASRDRQSHPAGPALCGTLRLDDRQASHVQAAWLEGNVHTWHGHMFTRRANKDF